MIKIIKHLKPYWKTVILAALLLMVQAYCDLALPQYTSNIIDVGIQNGGVAHIAPERITAEEYDEALLFMKAEEQSLWESLYTKDGDSYARNTDDEEQLEDADEKLLTSIVLTYQLGHMEETAFRQMVGEALGAQPQTAPLANQLDTMSLEDLGNLMHTEIKSFTGEDEEGNETVYVDVRPLLAQMMAAGQMDEQMLAQSRETMETTMDTIGAETLHAMGVAYAVSCDKEAGLDVDQIQMSYLWSAGARMFIMALIMMMAGIACGYLAARVGAGVGKDLRGRVFRTVMGFSNGEMDRFSTASLITRNSNDVQQVQIVCTLLLRMLLYAPIIGIGGVIKAWNTGAGMGWVIALGVLVIMGFVLVLVSIAMPKFKIMQKLVDDLNLVSREILTGLPVIRAFGRERMEEERFDRANENLKRTQLFTNRVMTFMMPGMMMIMNCLVITIMWVSANRIDTGELQVGMMTAFITYSMLIVMSFLMLTMMSIMLPRAGVAAERIDEVLKTKAAIADPAEDGTAEPCTADQGVVTFSHVSFRYPGAEEDVLHDISFRAEPGKVTAIIGSTGSGKSTLVNLIPRFYDVTEGSIALDGTDVRRIPLGTLRGAIGFVPQKGVLFSGTIASNLRFGREEATDEELARAARIAQAADFIEENEDKYERYIAQGGSNVSGGQKQRLAIARAIAKAPKIFVFDDSFSALDMKTDARLRKALGEEIAESTQIIVAQRISTVLHADQILVLDDGELVGKGTHAELMESCEVYQQIARSQLSEKELAAMRGSSLPGTAAEKGGSHE